MKVSQKETWPFSIRLLLLNKVNEIVRNSKQPEFYVEKKIYPLFTKESFENHTRMLVFSKPEVTGKQADSSGNAKVVLSKHF